MNPSRGRAAVRTVFLDAGGVLVFPNWLRVSAALAGRGLPADARALAEAEPHAKRELDQPGPATSDDRARSRLYFDLILDRAGVPRGAARELALQDLRAAHAERNLWETVPADVPPALARLKAVGLTLVVVSNSNGTVARLLADVGLGAFFDVIVDSQDHGVEKPDPALFRAALARSGAQPASTLHVGDLYHVDVAGARAAGIRAVLFDPAALYPDADCDRVASLGALADLLASAP